MITFYNTLTRKKEPFKPITDGSVSLYTCGPTVYDVAHIGNFRTFMFEDLLKRVLLLSGLKVKHVMNITDVDDKTIHRARAEGISLTKLTETYIHEFHHDLKWLKMIPADEYPKATHHVDGMIQMISSLIESGHAYKEDDGSVYFKVKSYPEYGQLSRLIFDEQQSTERIESDEYSKESVQDFALWKGWKEEDGDVYWDSPWGKGRPGWHIECSSMSMEYLGDHFDIHCGGVDNMFPHHENEIAQSKCASDTKFVNMWLHSEHLMVEGGKMSKSDGNFFTINELRASGYSPENIRYQLLSGHYRTKINFSIAKKMEGEKVIKRINEFYERLMALQRIEGSNNLPEEYHSFQNHLFSDLNTPKALAIFFEYMRSMNKRMDSNGVSEKEVADALNFVEKFDSIFGLLRQDDHIPASIKALADSRNKARLEKDWDLADELRNKIEASGWDIKDSPDGPKLSKK